MRTTISSNLQRIRTSFTGKRKIHSSLPSLGILHHEWVVGGAKNDSTSTNQNKNEGGTVLFLHGLLGNGKNLRGTAKRLMSQNPNLKALLIDLRGHGSSSIQNEPNNQNLFSPPHTMKSCANDIVETMRSLGLAGHQSPIGVVGHSFGGRCALQYLHATKFSEEILPKASVVNPPRHTWLLDTVPGQAHGSVSRVIEAVSSVPMPIDNKNELVRILVEEKQISKEIALWMTTNLKRVDASGFAFTFNLEIVQSILKDFPNQNFLELLSQSLSEQTGKDRNNIHLVMAGKNDGWSQEIMQSLNEIKKKYKDQSCFDLIRLKNAGHWVHVDDLDGLMIAMKDGFI